MRPRDWNLMWELLAIWHHSAKFGDCRYFDSVDVMFLIHHMTLRDYIFEELNFFFFYNNVYTKNKIN